MLPCTLIIAHIYKAFSKFLTGVRETRDDIDDYV